MIISDVVDLYGKRNKTVLYNSVFFKFLLLLCLSNETTGSVFCTQKVLDIALKNKKKK